MHFTYQNNKSYGKVRNVVAVTLGVLCLIILALVLTARRSASNVPIRLERAVEITVCSVYETLQGGDDADLLYRVLPSGVGIYYLFGPETEHPRHLMGTYKVNLHCLPSRYHVTIHPCWQKEFEDIRCEIWIAKFAGQGRWHDILTQFQCYFGTTSVPTTTNAARTIQFRSGRILEVGETAPQIHVVSDEGGELRVRLPSGDIVNFQADNRQ